MIWIISFATFAIGYFIGWITHRRDRNVYCADGVKHVWQRIGTETRPAIGYEEPSSYHLGGEYVYNVPVEVYKCQRCGEIKYIDID